MSFLFPVLLAGLLLICVPVLIHFLMRDKPRALPFPAFRFLVKRHRSNVTRLRLRHLLLLLLRIGLIVLLVLALAQPRVRDNPWSLPTDQPAAAVFVFDTSPSMDYTVAASQSRLKEAQKRALELLKLLPEGSEVAVLDTHRPPAEGQIEWVVGKVAAERIAGLKIEPANTPVTTRLQSGLKILGKVAGQKDREERWKRPRVLCVFSDRTPASWDVKAADSLQALSDEVPPGYERLGALRTEAAALQKLLPELRQRLAVTGNFNEQDLQDRLDKLRDRLGEVRPDDYPDGATTTVIREVRVRLRKLLKELPRDSEQLAPEVRDYHGRLLAAARAVLRNSAGFTSLYFDVGIDQPNDLALVDFQLVRELPERGTGPAAVKLQLRVELQGTGQPVQPTLNAEAGTARWERAAEVKPGQRDPVLFDLGPTLAPGVYQAKVLAKPSDHLAANNSRYLTFAVRRVLLVTDADRQAEVERWANAIQATRFGAALFHCDVKPVAEDLRCDDYDAVYLVGVRKPPSGLWASLKEYVANGGGLGLLPADGADAGAYNAQGQDLLPAKLGEVARPTGDGGEWNWAAANYDHPLMHPYQEWRQGSFDIARVPRAAALYWKLGGLQGKSAVLVSYNDGSPALVERVVDARKGRTGRVLLFTTPPGWGGWNDYFDGHSFGVALAMRAVGHLSGDADRQALNFLSSLQGPRVPIPVKPQVQLYKLQREVTGSGGGLVGDVTVEKDQNEVQIARAAEPGNYTLRNDEGKVVAWFSVNLPAEESDLARVGKDSVEAVLGPDAVLALGAHTDLREALQGHISEPLELLPVLMLALLVFLAVEGLLANRFYGKGPQPGT
jgi:hypothetical protein